MRDHDTVMVIGAGISGIGAGYHLGAAGISYTILEAQDDLGGVWKTHRWHGARCDSEFIKYSFSFKPFLSGQRVQSRAAIRDYLDSVAREFSIRDRIRFGTTVTKAVFNSRVHRWTVHTDQGTFTSRFLLNGNGYFAAPYAPEFHGAQRFRGELIHTSELDDRRTFPDSRVVVVGSGSTAICCAPELARVSKSVVLLQRSPSYIYEMPNNKVGWVTALCQSLYRTGITFPVTWLRYAIQCKDDVIFVGFRRFPWLARAFFRRHWSRTVGPDALRDHFSPRYNPWEQRIPVALGLKDKLRSGEVTIKTGEIDRFTESAIVLTTGEELPCDVCILATGHDVNLLKFDLYVDDKRVEVGGLNFFKGMMMGGVPNYFHPVGVWHSAWTHRAEMVTRLAIRIIRYMDQQGLGTVRIEPKAVDGAPKIMPNYVKRAMSGMPRLYGSYEIPTLDTLGAFGLSPRQFTFGSCDSEGRSNALSLINRNVTPTAQ